MREIKVSTAVFAEIWANRQGNEESEDEILRRLLISKSLPKNGTNIVEIIEKSSSMSGGVHDSRNDVHFPEGMEIYRNYKGKRYTAVASSGSWIRQDSGQNFTTINQLNSSIAAGPENVWNGSWRYGDEHGRSQPIDKLR